MSDITVQSIAPVLFVRDVAAAAEHYRAVLGFEIDFLFGDPGVVFAAVARGGHRLYLRKVAEPNFAALAAQEPQLVAAMIAVSDVHQIGAELSARGADIALPPTRRVWGGTDLHVRDPDGNLLCFLSID
jgi:uncharacterized glyoxalase superfamily protein PhnB